MKKLLLAAVALIALASQAEAAKIDIYRDMLIRSSYTIRYDNITPAPRVTNRDRVELYGKSGLVVERNEYLINRQKSGIITGDGQDEYEEVGDGNFNMCRLSKNGEDFFFTKYKKGDKYEYFGTKKNKVEANAKNYIAEMVEGRSYGDADVSRLINAMLPDDAKSAEREHYTFVAAGDLTDGLSYEDYRTSRMGITEVVRYYFSGTKLVKIASASYYKKSDGTIDGRKCIIKINEFSSVPDRTLLKLPDGLKDVTKRKNGQGGRTQ